MPVIREQRQFGLSPVRVVRAETGGDIVGQAISRAADQFSSIAFQEAAIVAEERGQKAGMAASRTDIVTIDPTTGLPSAYSAPSGMGSIATRAYQNMIDRRFEQSVQDEIVNRATEVAKTSSASQYKDIMSDYVAQMYGSAVSEGGALNAYGQTIKEIGEDYVAKTYANLQQKEAAAARERLIRERTLAAVAAEERINASLALGLDVSEEVAAYTSDARDLFLNGAITATDFKGKADKVEGWNGVSATTDLSRIRNSLSEADQTLLDQAIVDPILSFSLAQRLGISGLPEMVVAARVGSGNPESLLSVLQSRGKISADSFEAQVSQIVSSVSTQVDTTNLAAVSSGVRSLGLNPQFENAVIGNIVANSTAELLEKQGLGTEEYNQLIVELEKTNPNYSNIYSILGRGTDGELLALHLRKYVSPAARQEVAKALKDRTVVMSKVENAEEARMSREIQMSILDLTDPANAKSIEEQIRSNPNLPNQSSLLSSLREKSAIISIDAAAAINVSSLNALQRIENAVLSGRSLSDMVTVEDKAIYEYYSAAYAENPASTKAAMSARIEGYKAEIQDQVLTVQTEQAWRAAQNGLMPDDDGLALIEAKIFGFTIPQTLTELTANTQVVSLLDKGIVLPAVRSAFTRLAFATNEAEINTGIELFRKYSMGEISSESGVGGSQRIDILKTQLTDAAYQDLAAISFIYDQTAQPPLNVRQAFRNAGGTPKIDAAIKDILGVSPDNAFAETTMSRPFREELTQVLRYQYAIGGTMDRATADAILESYKSRVAKDDRVVSPLLDGKTAYAITGRMQDSEVQWFETQLRARMADDFASSGLVRAAPAATGMAVVVPEIAGFVARIAGNEEAVKRMEIEAKAATVEFVSPVVYRPVESAFATGIPTWEAGYMTEVNGIKLFQPYSVNGVPAFMEKPMSSYDQREMRLAAVNTWTKSLGYSDQVAQNESYVRYLATLEHIDNLDVFKSQPSYQEIYDVLGDRADTIFQEQRDRYTNEPWKYR